MPEQTINLYSAGSIPVIRSSTGTSLDSNSPIGNAIYGDAFSWQVPSNVEMTFGTPNATVTFDDADGVLGPSPVSGAQVTDQALSQATTIDGTTYSPSPNDILWQNPPAVYVRAEYAVTLYDDQGTEYTMAGVSVVRGYNITVTGVTFVGGNPPPGTVLTYIQGQSSYDASPNIPLNTICFGADTLIMTRDGEVRAGDVRAGMLVQTRDHGFQPVRWIGKRRLDAIDLAASPHLLPIRIAQGALGNGLPQRDLVLSPQHRVLVRSRIAQRMFGKAEVLTAAKTLLGIDGVDWASDIADVTYVHILLDAHQIVFAERTEAESMFTGVEAMKTLPNASLREVLALFPELRHGGCAAPARPLLSGRMGRKLAYRHLRNHRALQNREPSAAP